MKRALRSKWPASLALLVAAACGGSPTGTNSGDPLTEQEIQAVLDALGGSLGGVTSASVVSANVLDSGGPNLSTAAEPINVNLDVTVPCQSGGNIGLDGSMNGDVDTQTGEGSVDVDFKWIINGCVVPTQSTTVTVQGDPHIQFAATFTFSQDSFSMDGTQAGGFSFTTGDGRSGSCAIDLSFQSSVNYTTNAVTGSFNGTICGISGSGFQTFGGAG